MLRTWRLLNKILLSLVESVAQRLRKARNCCKVVSIEIRDSKLFSYSHQRKLLPTNITNEIYEVSKKLFDECWKGDKIRGLGVRVSELCSDEFIQATMFDDADIEKKKALDAVIDKMRGKYGNYLIFRGVFADRKVPPIVGGVDADDYPVMMSIL